MTTSAVNTKVKWPVHTRLPWATHAAAPRSLCKYMVEGEVSFRMCARGHHCERCAFAQMIEDAGENGTS